MKSTMLKCGFPEISKIVSVFQNGAGQQKNELLSTCRIRSLLKATHKKHCVNGE